MKIRLVKWLIVWLWRRYKYLMVAAVVPEDCHIHHNPTKALRGSYPKAGE